MLSDSGAKLIHRGNMRAIWNTPATTIVAAWMSALTGVGPSMASGSQMCSGNMADLPAPPMNINTRAVGRMKAAPAYSRTEPSTVKSNENVPA